jgi:hypothetical protein
MEHRKIIGLLKEFLVVQKKANFNLPKRIEEKD